MISDVFRSYFRLAHAHTSIRTCQIEILGPISAAHDPMNWLTSSPFLNKFAFDSRRFCGCSVNSSIVVHSSSSRPFGCQPFPDLFCVLWLPGECSTIAVFTRLIKWLWLLSYQAVLEPGHFHQVQAFGGIISGTRDCIISRFVHECNILTDLFLVWGSAKVRLCRHYQMCHSFVVRCREYPS